MVDQPLFHKVFTAHKAHESEVAVDFAEVEDHPVVEADDGGGLTPGDEGRGGGEEGRRGGVGRGAWGVETRMFVLEPLVMG
jgi:hypothetical protein